jgi:hypothetical protein
MTMQTSEMMTGDQVVRSSDETAAASQKTRVKYVPTNTGAAYWGPGSLMTFIVTGNDTGGAFFLAEMFVPPGGARRRTSTSARMNRSTFSKGH